MQVPDRLRLIGLSRIVERPIDCLTCFAGFAALCNLIFLQAVEGYVPVDSVALPEIPAAESRPATRNARSAPICTSARFYAQSSAL